MFTPVNLLGQFVGSGCDVKHNLKAKSSRINQDDSVEELKKKRLRSSFKKVGLL